MKGLRELCLSILIALFLISGVTYAQSPAEESYYKGVEHAIQGKFRKAKKEFEKTLTIDSFYSPAELSLETIKDVIEQKIKTETAIHLFKGTSYTKKGQYDKAINDYNKAIEINPKFAVAYINRGLAYRRKGQYNQAISDFNKAIEINPKFALAYTNRGLAYINKAQYDRAISDFNKAIEINPKFALAYTNRGLVYRKKGQYDQAISDYNKAIKINPKFALAYDNRGFVYLVKLGNEIKGCADWEKACELGSCKNYNHAKQNDYCL
ncbi:MAG: tetratricopeptide repeat protein [Thermodesulfovibrionia bacterium]